MNHESFSATLQIVNSSVNLDHTYHTADSSTDGVGLVLASHAAGLLINLKVKADMDVVLWNLSRTYFIDLSFF